MPIYANMPSSQASQAGLFGHGRQTNMKLWGISVTAENGSLKVNTPYSAAFVAEIKLLIPATYRKWDVVSKCWLVNRNYADTLKQIIDRSYGCDVVMPTVIAAPAEVFEVTFQADYVANCKNEASSVHANGDWSAKIPETVLRKWFKQA